jgi:lipoprotein-releasing system permease protein
MFAINQIAMGKLLIKDKIMFTRLEFLIAWRYLRSKRREGFISVTAIFSFVGIMIGVATLIIVMSVMNGFRYELVNRILGINAHLTIYSSQKSIKNYDEIIKKVREISGVNYVNPIIESQAMLSSTSKSTGAVIKGLRLDDLKNKSLIAHNILSGNINSLSDKNQVLIGSALARAMNLEVGDKMKMISAELNESLIGAIPRVKTYLVGGIFESGMYEYDASTIFMNFEMAEVHFRFANSASGIEIFVNDAEKMQEAKLKIYETLIDYPHLYFTDWKNANASFIDALKVERTVMFLILTLIILVAAFNIISSMIMLVKDKNKNIALLRTLGMTRSSVLRIFLICGSSIGIIGTMFGFVIGTLFSLNIDNIKKWLESLTGADLFNPAVYFLSTLPSKVFASDVILITVMSTIISFLATIYPAYKASKSNPAEVLRYE